MTELLIQVQGLGHTYMPETPFAYQALKDVDFYLAADEAVGVIGGTGAGKSTLLQHLNGLYKPQRGSVRVLGHDLADPDLDVRQVRRQVGLVFQRPEQQLFEQYVGDDVAFGPRAAGLEGEALRERVRWAMELVGLGFAAYKDRLTWTLSGGEQRKAALAGVLAMRPRVLILDEPTAGLDPAARRELLGHLVRFRQQGMALIVASHNMEDVAILSQRVYTLHAGRVALEGPADHVLTQAERLWELGLDVPPAVRIWLGLRERGIDLPDHPLTLERLASGIHDWLRQEERVP